MEARVGDGAAVRRSARLIAAAARDPIPVARCSSKASRIKCQIENGVTNAVKKEDGDRKHTRSTETDLTVSETQILRRQKSLKRLPSRDLEMELWKLGFRNVAGVDEAGRGPLAGPVVAAACIIPSSVTIPDYENSSVSECAGVDDSKKLTETQREELYAQIVATPGVAYAVHVVDAAKIDEVNILQATLLAMSSCIKKLKATNGEKAPDYVLVDGNRLPDDLPKEEAQFVIKGDAECHVIAAASILAKVTRDRMMLEYDTKWPVYGFKAHKGYGTALHMSALLKYGPCDIHRRSFAPLKGWIQNGGS